jgi:hypothetical protein
LPYLKELELTGNILYRKPGYRATMIKKLPGLLYLDGRVILIYKIGNNTIRKDLTNFLDEPSAKQSASTLRAERSNNKPEPAANACST